MNFSIAIENIGHKEVLMTIQHEDSRIRSNWTLWSAGGQAWSAGRTSHCGTGQEPAETRGIEDRKPTGLSIWRIRQ